MTKKLLSKSWFVVSSLLLCKFAFGFSLDDHSKITQQAVREFAICFPESLPLDAADVLVSANLNEDTNLIRKWSRYSHFYHPHKQIQMRRYDSSVRVRELEAHLHELLSTSEAGDQLAVLKDLGHVLHHIQDMASPLHVVPIMHSLNEPFESYHAAEDDYPASPPSEIDCAVWDSLEAGSLMYIHREMAVATLNQVQSPLIITRNQEVLETTWEGFWKESEDTSFGHYGFLGAHFGEGAFEENGTSFEVSTDLYDDLRRSQLRLAIDATKAALLWMKQGGTKLGIEPELK